MNRYVDRLGNVWESAERSDKYVSDQEGDPWVAPGDWILTFRRKQPYHNGSTCIRKRVSDEEFSRDFFQVSETMSGAILSKKFHIATEKELSSPWGGVSNGKRFRCYFCGHYFQIGDAWRVEYTNDIPGTRGNPLVCVRCDGPDLRERYTALCVEARIRFWWLIDD